jgi:hypothetical protein
VDHIPPTVASINRAAGDPTNASAVPFTVKFDEAVTGVDASDFVATPSGLAGAGNITGVTGSGDTWTVTVDTGTGSGTIGLNLIDDDTITDIAGNKLGGVGTGNGNFTTGQSYTLDRTPPLVATFTRVDASPTSQAQVHYAVTFTKSVGGVDPTDFAVTGGLTGASVALVTGGGTSWTVTVDTGSGSGSLGLTLNDDDSITDVVGNPLGGTGAGNGTASGPAYTVDKIAPTVTSVAPVTVGPTNGATVTYLVTFSEAVTGVDATDFTPTTAGALTGASVTNVSGSGTSWTVTVGTGTGDGQVGLTALNDGTIADLAGNLLSGSPVTGAAVVVDKTLPSAVSVVRNDANPTNAAAVTYTVTFSEDVTGVDPTDFALVTTGVAGAKVTGVGGGPRVYTVAVSTGTGSGTVGLNLLDDDTIRDQVNNPLGGTGTGNGALTGPAYTLDRTPPAVAGIALADATPTVPGTVHFVVTFTEPVTGVDGSDFALTTAGMTGAAVTGVSGSGTTYTVAVDTGFGKGTVRLDVADNDTVLDAVNNPLGGAGTGNGDFTSGPAYAVVPADSGTGGVPTPPRPPAVVAGAESGSSFVTVYDSAGKVLATFFAYDPSFAGGVHVALADVNGDGIADVITGPGSGGGPHVKVIDGTKLHDLLADGEIADSALLYNFQAYREDFRGGVYVAAGDINGDGVPDVVTGAGDTGGPAVTVFSGKDGSQMYSLMVYDDSFRGGVTVAVGDVTGDGRADIIAGTGPGGGPAVVVVDGSTRQIASTFYAFDPNFRGGVNVAAADLDGSGVAAIIAGEGVGGNGTVAIFRGLGTGKVPAAQSAFDASAGGTMDGTRVALADVNGDGKPELVVAGGPGSSPSTARVYDTTTLKELDLFFATDPAYAGGVNLGGVFVDKS